VTLAVSSTAGFHHSDVFHYDDVQPGDRFSINLSASLTQTAPGHYEYHSQAGANLRTGRAIHRPWPP
jgi:hypothetical protein